MVNGERGRKPNAEVKGVTSEESMCKGENRQRLTATRQRPQKFVPSYNLLLYTGGTVGPALCHAEVTPATVSVYARQEHRTAASKKLYLDLF